MKRELTIALAVALASRAYATPVPAPAKIDKEAPAAARKLTHTDTRARVAVATTPGHAGELVPTRDAVARAEPPLSPEEATAQQIEKLLRGPLRGGVTGLYVVDATTGAPIFAVNADERLNPASNVKMIATATALEDLGPAFRYPTRLLAALPGPDHAVRSDLYLLGSYDPLMAAPDLDDIAAGLAAREIVAVHGDIIVGGDGTRDGLFRPSIPIEIHATTPGIPPRASVPDGFDLVRVVVTAKTLPYAAAPRLTYQTSQTVDDQGRPRVVVTIGGSIGKTGATTYKLALPLEHRGRAAAYALRAALRARGITVTGEVKVEEVGDYLGESLGHGILPVELARHESRPLASIIADVNKYSVNWLAERVVISAAALADHAPATTDGAVTAMYAWLERHADLKPDDLVIDSGSGLSYRTQISARELVSVVRGASGFAKDRPVAPEVAQAWLASLAVGGHDGTLGFRFRAPEVRGRVRGKTGTLSTAIALSGFVEIDPQRPLAFALVTNTNSPLSKAMVRKTHEQLVTAICQYAQHTASHTVVVTKPSAPAPAPVATHPALPVDELESPDEP